MVQVCLINLWLSANTLILLYIFGYRSNSGGSGRGVRHTLQWKKKMQLICPYLSTPSKLSKRKRKTRYQKLNVQQGKHCCIHMQFTGRTDLFCCLCRLTSRCGTKHCSSVHGRKANAQVGVALKYEGMCIWSLCRMKNLWVFILNEVFNQSLHLISPPWQRLNVHVDWKSFFYSFLSTIVMIMFQNESCVSPPPPWLSGTLPVVSPHKLV